MRFSHIDPNAIAGYSVFMLLLLTLLTGPAHAFQSVQSGPLLELGFGGGFAGGTGVLSAQLTTGWWFGRYDDDYAIGRFTALLLTQELHRGAGAFRYAPLLEVRRSIDLFVVAPHYLVAIGPLMSDSVGVALRVGGGLKFRRSRRLGFTARVVGGLDLLADQINPTVGLTIGGGWSSPLHSTEGYRSARSDAPLFPSLL